MDVLKVFIGYDSREDIAFHVCRESMARKSSIWLDIQPIKQTEMRERGLYWREHDALSSTEFTFTRFLTPYLTGYKGWAVFVDCDFLFRHDIATVLDYRDHSNAVMVVKHNYVPLEQYKMDGAIQTRYPRKNWSSFMLINCDHDQVKQNLTLERVNKESGMYLHRFEWLTNDVIGELPIAYNYLEGWHTKDDCPNPIGVHFTRGGPWFRDYMNVEYGDEWVKVARSLENV
jgi:lipopolysaccharide biosynthesis glycosyltransferase